MTYRYLAESNSAVGTLFHATKASLRTGKTQYKPIDHVNPNHSKSLRRVVLVTSNSVLTTRVLDTICDAAAQGRPFDLIVNNCQRFCTEVLITLVSMGYVSQAEFESLRIKGFTPLW